jgi:hypothetical protein
VVAACGRASGRDCSPCCCSCPWSFCSFSSCCCCGEVGRGPSSATVANQGSAVSGSGRGAALMDRCTPAMAAWAQGCWEEGVWRKGQGLSPGTVGGASSSAGGQKVGAGQQVPRLPLYAKRQATATHNGWIACSRCDLPSMRYQHPVLLGRPLRGSCYLARWLRAGLLNLPDSRNSASAMIWTSNKSG